MGKCLCGGCMEGMKCQKVELKDRVDMLEKEIDALMGQLDNERRGK